MEYNSAYSPLSSTRLLVFVRFLTNLISALGLDKDNSKESLIKRPILFFIKDALKPLHRLVAAAKPIIFPSSSTQTTSHSLLSIKHE